MINVNSINNEVGQSIEDKGDILGVISESNNLATEFSLLRDRHDVYETWMIEYMCELGSYNGLGYGIAVVTTNGRSDVRRQSEVFSVEV